MNTDDRRTQPFDAGLQPERTALAWRRTGLALAVGALVGVRILPAVLGDWALIPAGAGLIVAFVVLWASHRRYLTQHEILTSADSDRIPLPGGGLPALVASLVIFAGLAVLLVVLASA